MRNYIFIASITLLLGGCGNCDSAFTEFTSKDSAPLIFVESRKSECIYNIEGDFWIDSLHLASNGELLVKDDVFYLRIDSLEHLGWVRFFDFNEAPGGWYEVVIKSNEQNVGDSKLLIKIDLIVNVLDDQVFKFRMANGFRFMGEALDIVFFVSKRKGIIGSYVSEVVQGQEIITVVRGDILKNEIDYSDKMFGELL